MRFFRQMAILCALGVIAVAACDDSSPYFTPYAKVGTKCRTNGAFARTDVNLLQCKSGRWRVIMSLESARGLIRAQNAEMGIPPATIAPPAPAITSGAIDSAVQQGDRIRIKGWVYVNRGAIVTLDGVWVPTIQHFETVPGSYPFASGWEIMHTVPRPDVPPPTNHRNFRAFDTYIDTGMKSTSRVCVTDYTGPWTSPGPQPTWGTPLTSSVCADVAIPNPRTRGPAFGQANVESIVVTGDTVKVSGWALRTNRNLGNDTGIVIRNVGQSGGGAKIYTSIPRPDVAAAFPGTGDMQGFEVTLSLPSPCPCGFQLAFENDLQFEYFDGGPLGLGPGTIGGHLYLPSFTVNR